MREESVSESIVDRYNRLHDYVVRSPDAYGEACKDREAVRDACKKLDDAMKGYADASKNVEDALSSAEAVMSKNLPNWNLYIQSYKGWMSLL